MAEDEPKEKKRHINTDPIAWSGVRLNWKYPPLTFCAMLKNEMQAVRALTECEDGSTWEPQQIREALQEAWKVTLDLQLSIEEHKQIAEDRIAVLEARYFQALHREGPRSAEDGSPPASESLLVAMMASHEKKVEEIEVEFRNFQPDISEGII